jgi:ABC-type glycerol-3-phosphate transport system substrate-binding protein
VGRRERRCGRRCSPTSSPAPAATTSILLGTDGAVQTFGYAGFLEPLNAYLESGDFDEWFDLEDIYPSVLEANTVEGNVYGMSYYAFGPGMIYRTDIFERYGVSVPTTMEEFEAALATIKAGLAADGITDVYPLTMRAGPGEEPSLDLTGFVYAYAGYPAWFEGGADTVEDDPGEPGPSPTSPAPSATASRPSCAWRASTARPASPPTPGST